MFVLEVHMYGYAREVYITGHEWGIAARERNGVLTNTDNAIMAAIEANDCPEGWWVMENKCEVYRLGDTRVQDPEWNVYWMDNSGCPQVFREIAEIVYGTPLPSGNARAEVPSGVPLLRRALVAMRDRAGGTKSDGPYGREQCLIAGMLVRVIDAGLAALDEEDQ